MRSIFLVFILFFSIKSMIAQSVDEIIQKHIDAIGGIANWNQIKTIEVRSIIENESESYSEIKKIEKNKNFRKDIVLNGRSNSNINIHSDKKYFVIMSEFSACKYLPDNLNNSVYALEKNDIVYYTDEMDFEDPFLNYKFKNIDIKMLPIEFINDVEYYKFYLKYPNGKEQYIYVSSATNLIYKIILVNSEIEDIKEYVSYHTLLNGILFPKEVISSYGKITNQAVVINPKFDKTIFKTSIVPFDNKYKSY